jgi:glycerol-3-phosphate acyltransferase PlsY
VLFKSSNEVGVANLTQILAFIGVLLLSYLIGSIPFGFIVVHLKTGKDIRRIESGRTGGTNAMRAAGYPAGIATGALDILKGASAIWLARWLVPGNVWLEIASPLLAILGHNYSIFLAEYNKKSGFRLRGGAGGAPAIGGVAGLWLPSIFILVPTLLIILFGIGYASVATMSVGVIATLIFLYRYLTGASPWQYMLYGVVSELILMWALRPNIQRLFKGTERLVGWRARRKKTKAMFSQTKTASNHSSSSTTSSSV